MTNLVEKIYIRLTLHRDEDPYFPYDDILGLEVLPQRGMKRIGNATFEWVKGGAEEVPEIGGGDN